MGSDLFQHVLQSRAHASQAGLQLQRAPVFTPSLGPLTLLLKETAQQFMSFCKITIGTHRGLRPFSSLVESIGAGKRERIVVEMDC
jgi:hypothetical protein